jgi:hypothetical protein
MVMLNGLCCGDLDGLDPKWIGGTKQFEDK